MLFRFLIYGALGWCSEIVWTAVRKRITGIARDWLLMGETSLWAFPMYGSITFLYEPLHDAVPIKRVIVSTYQADRSRFCTSRCTTRCALNFSFCARQSISLAFG